MMSNVIKVYISIGNNRPRVESGLLFDLFLQELDFPLEVDMVETFEVLVPDFFHVEAVDRADVDALLAADALRVVELRDHDRLVLPVVRAVEHVDAARRGLPLALAAAHGNVD